MAMGCTAFRNMHRRNFLRLSAVGLSGFTWAQMFQATAAQPKAKARQMIIIYLPGGPPHLDMFDMKPDANEQIRGPWKPIPTKVPSLQICELLPNLAKVADKFTILRSVNQKGYPLEGQHGLAAFWPFVTGNRRNLRGTPKFPLYGSVMAKVRPGPGDLPAFVTFNKRADHFGAHHQDCFLGPVYEPMEVRIDDPNDKLNSMLTAQHLDLATLERRADTLKRLDEHMRQLDAAESIIGGLDGFQQQAFALLRSPKLREALDLKREPESSAGRYGREGKSFLAARRLIEAGVPCVYFTFGSWDSHGRDNLGKTIDQLKVLDTSLAALLEDLDAHGQLDSTIVLLGGEMGRTPKLNLPGYGREHWNEAQSFLLAGGGFQRGCVVGATDKIGAFVADKLANATSLARTIYHLLGIDADQELMMPDGRPIKIVVEDAPLIQEAIV